LHERIIDALLNHWRVQASGSGEAVLDTLRHLTN
jgi:hypothetical protein